MGNTCSSEKRSRENIPKELKKIIITDPKTNQSVLVIRKLLFFVGFERCFLNQLFINLLYDYCEIQYHLKCNSKARNASIDTPRLIILRTLVHLANIGYFHSYENLLSCCKLIESEPLKILSIRKMLTEEHFSNIKKRILHFTKLLKDLVNVIFGYYYMPELHVDNQQDIAEDVAWIFVRMYEKEDWKELSQNAFTYIICIEGVKVFLEMTE